MIPPVEEEYRMTRYIHHISGRLRTRYPQLRNNPRGVRATEAAIRQIKGVLSVEASAVTGSLLIRYDPAGVERETLLAAIQETKLKLGLIQHSQPPVRASINHTSRPEKLGDKVLGMLVEKCIERSAIAIFAALL